MTIAYRTSSAVERPLLEAVPAFAGEELKKMSDATLMSLLYSEAISGLKNACSQARAANVEKRCQAICQTITLLTDISNALCSGEGIPEPVSLTAAYIHMIIMTRLGRVRQENARKELLRVIATLRSLRGGWRDCPTWGDLFERLKALAEKSQRLYALPVAQQYHPVAAQN